MSNYMKAVLIIACSSKQISDDFLGVINVEAEEIHWDRLDYNSLCTSSKTAIAWAKAIWCDHVPSDGVDLFSTFDLLDPQIQKNILRGLRMRFGIS